MTRPKPPAPLAKEDLLGELLDVDIDAVVTPIMESRHDSPIVPRSRANDLHALLPARLPGQGLPLDDVLQELEGVAAKYVRRNTHPGFFGYVASSGLPTDPLGHAMVAALNQNLVGYPSAPGAATVERVVVSWFRQLLGLPAHADGLLLSGGSAANLAALAAALYKALGADAVSNGLCARAVDSQPVILAAESVHFSVQRAAVTLGIGERSVHIVPVDENFRMRPRALERALDEIMLEGGDRPIAVVASAGSTMTGAIDPLDEIADICERYGLWLHVDAAYGGAGLLSQELRPLFAGIEHADSVTLDLHKWFYLAFDGSVLLFSDPQAARRVFFAQSDYVQFPKDGPPEEFMFFHLGPELSRRARALPAYLALRHYGADRLGRNVLYNAQCARYLAELTQAEPDTELINAPQRSICCCRFAPQSLRGDPQTVDHINIEIRQRLEAEGDFFLSPTHIDGRPALRVCIINHATRATHMEGLLA
ncbi:MAG: pyridoxal phosphate-dependent decarboxylase family protein, partial [Gammaproteobacteria bacterium]